MCSAQVSDSQVRRDKRTVNSLLLSMQLPLINVNSMTQRQIPGRLGGHVSRAVGSLFSAIILNPVEKSHWLFVEGDEG